MIKYLHTQITAMIASRSECSPKHLTSHFIKAHGVVSHYGWASFIAALPCARETGHRISAKWKSWIEKKQPNQPQGYL